MFTLHNGDCLEYDIPPFDVAIVDPPYGTGERLRVDGEYVCWSCAARLDGRIKELMDDSPKSV